MNLEQAGLILRVSRGRYAAVDVLTSTHNSRDDRNNGQAEEGLAGTEHYGYYGHYGDTGQQCFLGMVSDANHRSGTGLTGPILNPVTPVTEDAGNDWWTR